MAARGPAGRTSRPGWPAGLRLAVGLTLAFGGSACLGLRSPAAGRATVTGSVSDDRVVEVGSTVVLGVSGARPGEPAVAVGVVPTWRQVTAPDVEEWLPAFEAPADWGDRYGSRLRGYLLPSVSGDYTLWLASDDSGELWLSPDADPAHKRLVASVRNWSAPHGWDEAPGQKSAPVPLAAGRRYYVEVLHKEGSGGDHVAVAWAGPGLAREVVPGRCLAPWGAGAGSRPGGISREVWRGVPGGRVHDLTTAPVFPGGATVTLSATDPSAPSFRADRPGRYVFEGTSGAGRDASTVRAGVLVTDVLRNGDFEVGAAAPAFWELAGDTAGVEMAVEAGTGVGGSRCVRLSTRPGVTAQAVLRQTLELAPYTPYLLRGSMRGRDLRGAGPRPAGIGIGNLWMMENGPKREADTSAWTPFEVDFATGPSGRVEVVCKLGFRGDASSGTVWFDDLTLQRNAAVETFVSRHFVLHLYRDQVELATRAAVERIMAYTDEVCEAYAELTGYEPGGDRQSAWAPDKVDIDALGWSGNPVLWVGNRAWIRENWPRDRYCPEVFLHELAHNYDHPNSTFHGHFCELKMYYALETRDLAIAEDGWTRGEATRHRWEVRSRHNRELGVTDEIVQTHTNIRIRDRIGWEPFRTTYRYLLGLRGEQVPKTAWDKFRAWHDKLAEFSGADVWAFYTPDEQEFVRYYYQPRPAPADLPKATALPPDQTTVALSSVGWDEASVGWERPEYGFYASGEKRHPNALYAHAPSRYRYRLGGQWRRFEASCGLRKGHVGSVVFVVRGDGRELFRSDLVRDGRERPVSVEVTGVADLELVVEDGGNGVNSDHGVWFSPQLLR